MTADERSRRLLYLLHMGLVEIRNLARAPGNGMQISKMADALEIVPEMIVRSRDEQIPILRDELRKYQSAFPTQWDPTGVLDHLPLPEHFDLAGRITTR